MALGYVSPLVVSVAIFILQNHLSHKEIVTEKNKIRDKYDYIVIGSGTGGSVVSHRLAEAGNHVLLIEAGGPAGGTTDIPGGYWEFFNTEIDWNYTNAETFVGRAFLNHVIPENKGLIIGGTCSINTLIYNRGNRRCFNYWEKYFGAEGWSYKDVLPFFLKFENNTDPIIANNGFHSTSGPVQISSWAKPPPIMKLHQKAVNEFGFQNNDLNGAEQIGTMLAQAFINGRGVRASAANSFIDPNPFPDNLHVMTRAFVTRILFKGKRAVGVQFVRHGKTQRMFVKKEVILSAGAINSPQILMLSGIGPKEQLEHFKIPVIKDLPVGENLQNHPGITLNFLIDDKYKDLVGEGSAITMQQLYEFYQHNRGPLTTHYRAMTYFNTKSNPDTLWPNVDFETGLYLFPTNLSDHVIRYGERKEEWDKYNSAFLGKYYFLTHTILQRLRSFGSVRLQSANPFKYPLIDPQFLSHPQDLEDLVEGIKFTLYFFETSSIAKYLVRLPPIPGCKFCPNKYAYECDSYVRCVVEQITDSGYHACGTNRMGSVDRHDVVVDPRLRVKGMSGLRVCDASIMPEITNGNSNAPTLMIGEKCAHMIIQDN